jgi:hypothetical protein
MSQPLLDEILAKLQALPPEKLAELEALVKRGLGSPLWMPTPGPQRDAYACR